MNCEMCEEPFWRACVDHFAAQPKPADGAAFRGMAAEVAIAFVRAKRAV